jgi:hypothetical protein
MIGMSTKKPWIVDVPQAPPSPNDDGASFIDRVREVIKVVRAGRPSGGNRAAGEASEPVVENPNKSEES